MRSPGIKRVLSLAPRGVLLGALLFATLCGLLLIPAVAKAAPGTLYNVQVSVETQSTLPDNYVISAYNTTGALVATSQSQYPAGSFQLPSGSYILTATATQQSSYYQPYPVSSGGVATSQLCCVYRQPIVEYGYAVSDVPGSTTLTIKTTNASEASSSTVTIHANFPNGTAAKGASVSASVLGNWYWGYGTKSVSMYNTTNAAGVATLLTPNAPVLVNAWASLPINLPTNQTTTQRTIAGEKVNVTVYWQPTYAEFGGWSLLTPPQQDASMVLHYQQPQYYVGPYMAGGSGASGVAVPGSAASSASSPPSQGAVAFPEFGPGGISTPSGSSQSPQSARTVYVNTGGGVPTTITSTTTYSAASSYDNNLLILYAATGLGAAIVAGLIVGAMISRRNRPQA